MVENVNFATLYLLNEHSTRAKTIPGELSRHKVLFGARLNEMPGVKKKGPFLARLVQEGAFALWMDRYFWHKFGNVRLFMQRSVLVRQHSQCY